MTNQPQVQGGEANGWEQTVYVFLAEKERRCGSMRTVQAYSLMLFQFFDALGKTPDEVSSRDVFSYPTALASREGSLPRLPSRPASPVSVFLRLMGTINLVTSNPCDNLEPHRAMPEPTRGLAPDDIEYLRLELHE
jgi:hypothetical protein